MYTIASFDVGIKNLAFCIMQYDKQKLSGKQFPILCWKNLDLTDTNRINDHLCSGIIKKTKNQCKYPPKIQIKDKYYCCIHNPDKTKQIKPPTNTKYIPLDKLCITLVSTLDEYQEWWDCVDEIIIEKQFTKNRKMICLSNMVYSYFIMKYIMNNESRLKKIKFIKPKHKLNVYDGPFIKSPRKTKKNQKYQRKQLAIKHCR